MALKSRSLIFQIGTFSAITGPVIQCVLATSEEQPEHILLIFYNHLKEQSFLQYPCKFDENPRSFKEDIAKLNGQPLFQFARFRKCYGYDIFVTNL